MWRPKAAFGAGGAKRGGAGPSEGSRRIFSRCCIPSTSLHRSHSSQVQCHADQFPLSLHAMQPAHAELAEAQDVLDPAVGRFGEPTVSALVIARILVAVTGWIVRGFLGVPKGKDAAPSAKS